ncbi:MAG: hypothetical protein HOO97_05585 [Sideroxydans sp.]|nr:hypothetical protein [Sideroxydans sp.]
MQTLKTPEVGKTYTSETDPSLSIYIERITTVKADPEYGVKDGFVAEGCAPADKNNPTAFGIDFSHWEWEELKFRPSEQPTI